MIHEFKEGESKWEELKLFRSYNPKKVFRIKDMMVLQESKRRQKSAEMIRVRGMF